MKELSKFIPMEGNVENLNGNAEAGNVNGGVENGNSTFKVCGSSENLPAKPSFWSKVKSFLTQEITVELTPYEKKVEAEVNEFLHKKITWKGIRDFLMQEIEITW